MGEENKKTSPEYTFNDAYDIHGRGVGRLNIEKASSSDAFITKAKELAESFKKINVPVKTKS